MTAKTVSPVVTIWSISPIRSPSKVTTSRSRKSAMGTASVSVASPISRSPVPRRRYVSSFESRGTCCPSPATAGCWRVASVSFSSTTVIAAWSSVAACCSPAGWLAPCPTTVTVTASPALAAPALLCPVALSACCTAWSAVSISWRADSSAARACPSASCDACESLCIPCCDAACCWPPWPCWAAPCWPA